MAENIRTTFFILFCILAAFLPGNSTTAESANPDLPLEIINITPDGEDVPAGKKIVFQFNRTVVPVGAMDRKASEIPITINPAVKGQWRWLNTSTLACILDEDSPLKPATRYEIQINPGIMTEDGTTMSEPVTHRFITERPKVVYSRFRTWRSPSLPVIRVIFNQPVSRASVENNLFFDIPWLEQRRVKLYAEPDEREKETPMFLPLPGENITLVNIPAESKSEPAEDESFLKKMFKSIGGLFSGQTQDEADARPDAEAGREARRVWLVFPEKELPNDAALSLMVEPGLESSLGPEKGVDRRELVSFYTFPEFRFEGIECFSNQRDRIHIYPGDSSENSALCNPTRSVMMVFTSPVLNSEIKENTSFEPSVSWDDVNDYSRLDSPHRRGAKYFVYLPGILKPAQTYTVEARKALSDEFGRKLKTPINIRFATDHMPPDFNLTNPVSILEKNVDTDACSCDQHG